jgi:hypothetical protein
MLSLIALMSFGAAPAVAADVFSEALRRMAPFLEATAADFVGEAGREESRWAADLQTKAKTRDDLAAAGIAGARPIGFEFELIVYDDGRPASYLRSFVSAGAEFIGMEVETLSVEDELYVSGDPLDAFVGVATPLAEAAEALVVILSGPECASTLRFATAETFMPDVTTPAFRNVLGKQIEPAPAMPPICAAFRGVGREAVALRIDDVAYLALDDAGEALGVLRTSFTGAGDALGIDSPRFRPF